MFAVVEYYNYHTDMLFSVLHIYNNYQTALEKAIHYAQLQSEEEGLPITDEIQRDCLTLNDCIEYFSTGNGYGRNVYAVIALPNIEDNIQS
jgi:hypothetical protein